MLKNVFKSKIHRATVTESNLHYEGSLTIDEDLMEQADISEYEQVHVFNVTNGERIITYAIKGPRGSRVICANGAAHHQIKKDDLVIIVTYAQMTDDEMKNFSPTVVLVDKNNDPVNTKDNEKAFTTV